MNRETYRRAFDDIPFSDDFETRTIKLLQDRARNQEKEKMTMTFSKHRKLAVTLAPPWPLWLVCVQQLCCGSVPPR